MIALRMASALVASLLLVLDVSASAIETKATESNNSKSNLHHVFELDGEEVRVSNLDLDIFQAVFADIQGQGYKASLSGDTVENLKYAAGQVSVGGTDYSYEAFDGEIWVDDDSGDFLSTIPAGKIMSYVELVGQGEIDEAKCPWCVPVLIIAGHELLCSASEAGSHATCNQTCQCGVAAVHTACLLGIRQTSCVCFPCDNPPQPPTMFPVFGDWGGLLVPIGSIGFDHGPFIIPD